MCRRKDHGDPRKFYKSHEVVLHLDKTKGNFNPSGNTDGDLHLLSPSLRLAKDSNPVSSLNQGRT